MASKLIRAMYAAWSTSTDFEDAIKGKLQKNLNLTKLDILGPITCNSIKFGGDGFDIKSITSIDAENTAFYCGDLEFLFKGVIAIDLSTTLTVPIVRI